MSALGRWVGSWAGEWFGLGSGEPPGPHTIAASGIRYVARVGRPTVGRIPGHGGWAAEYIPPPHRIRAVPIHAAPSFGRPSIRLRAAASPVLSRQAVGRPQVWARPLRMTPQSAPPVARVDRYALARRLDDEEMML